MLSVLFLTLGKRRGERDKENRNKIRIMLCPSLHLSGWEWKFFLEGEGQGRQLQHTGVHGQETRGLSDFPWAWPHVPCIDLLALPHIKIDQIEYIHAHTRDLASKPPLFAPRPEDNVSKLVRTTMWALWHSSVPLCLLNWMLTAPTSSQTRAEPIEKKHWMYTRWGGPSWSVKKFMYEHRVPLPDNL